MPYFSNFYLDVDADAIYEYVTGIYDTTEEEDEQEYREDKMEQMISRHGY
jgi:hypothetical protein